MERGKLTSQSTIILIVSDKLVSTVVKTVVHIQLNNKITIYVRIVSKIILKIPFYERKRDDDEQ